MNAAAHSQQEPAGAGEQICFLHIGPHKTGTTSIQDALFENGDELAKANLYYPTISGERAGKQRRNHTPLTRQSNFKADELTASPFWEELSIKISKIKGSIVVSSEHFAECMRAEGPYEKVVDFFIRHGYRVVVVAYVRDQPAWLNSWYTQDQRNFVSRDSFSQFLDRALDIGLVDPWSYLRRSIDDPRIEVRVVSFEQAVRIGVARSFLNAIGAPQELEIAEPTPSNQNLGVKGMFAAQEIMRRVNGRVRSMPNYNALYERFKKLMRGREWEKTSYIGYTPEQEQIIRERYAVSNDAFAREYFGVDWASLCPPRPARLREFDFEGATDPDRIEVMEVVDQMVEAIETSRSDANAALPPMRGKKGKKGGGKKDGGSGGALQGVPEKSQAGA